MILALVYHNGTQAIPFSASAWSSPEYLPPFALQMHATSNGPAWVMARGILRGLDTSAWAVGSLLWSDGAGGFSTTPPSYTDVAPVVSVGVVRAQHATAGVLEVDVRAYPPHALQRGRSVADSHPATAVSYTDAGDRLSAADVQAAIDALRSIKGSRAWSWMMRG